MDPSCTLAEELYDLVALQAVQWLYLLMSIASLVLVAYTARCYLHRTIFEDVTKELIIALYISIALYSTFLIITQLAQLTYRYAAREKCEAQVPKAWCIFRYMLTMLIFSFLILHIGITVQHALNTFHVRNQTQKIVARLSILIAFAFPVALGIFAYAKNSLEGRTAYCGGTTAASGEKKSSFLILMAYLYAVLVLDILNALTSVLLWMYNWKRQRAEQCFDLSLAFHRRQNLYAMEQFLPVATVHAVVYSVFFVFVYFTKFIQSSMSRGWYTVVGALANVIPWYCLLCPLIFLILIRKGRFARASHVRAMVRPEKAAKEVYFATLRDQWK